MRRYISTSMFPNAHSKVKKAQNAGQMKSNRRALYDILDKMVRSGELTTEKTKYGSPIEYYTGHSPETEKNMGDIKGVLSNELRDLGPNKGMGYPPGVNPLQFEKPEYDFGKEPAYSPDDAGTELKDYKDYVKAIEELASQFKTKNNRWPTDYEVHQLYDPGEHNDRRMTDEERAMNNKTSSKKASASIPSFRELLEKKKNIKKYDDSDDYEYDEPEFKSYTHEKDPIVNTDIGQSSDEQLKSVRNIARTKRDEAKETESEFDGVLDGMYSDWNSDRNEDSNTPMMHRYRHAVDTGLDMRNLIHLINVELKKRRQMNSKKI